MNSKIYNIFIFLILFLSFYQNGNAQAPNWVWAKGIYGTNLNISHSITVDAYGNVYTIGNFHETTDFDPGPGIFSITPIGSEDIFISKLDNNGNFVWAVSFGGNNSLSDGYSIGVDALGYIYATGVFGLTVDFDPGPGIFNLTAAGGLDLFILKLTSSGNLVWAKCLVGECHGLSIALDFACNVYTTGFIEGQCDFDPGIGIYYLNPVSFTVPSAFISKLDSTGNFVWAKMFDGISNTIGRSTTVDNFGNVYSTGLFSGPTDFDPGSGVFNLTANGVYNVYISKLDNSGNFVWAKKIECDEATSIITDNSGSGDIYASGTFWGIRDFDPGSGIFNLNANGYTNMYLLKLDSSGNYVWAKAFGETSSVYGGSIYSDVSGNVYASGSFYGTSDFDPGTPVFNLIADSGTYNIFISKISNMGNFIWAKAIDGMTAHSETPSIILDGSENAYITGVFVGSSISFDQTTLLNFDTTNYTSDIFIAKLDHITGVESTNLNDFLKIYPNPASSGFYIEIAGNYKQVSISITELTGKIIYKAGIDDIQKLKVITNNFLQGIYFVEVKTSDFIETKKIVIVK